MNDFTHIDSAVELAEALAEEWGLYASEQELSDAFDEQIAPHVIKEYGADDIIAMSEAFNNWTDSLCKDGNLHSSQCNEYCYVGTHAEE